VWGRFPTCVGVADTGPIGDPSHEACFEYYRENPFRPSPAIKLHGVPAAIQIHIEPRIGEFTADHAVGALIAIAMRGV
jgi:hypothetical protein